MSAERSRGTGARDALARWLPRPVRRSLARGRDRLKLGLDVAAATFGRADLALFHEFSPPPGGGGHQFLRALSGEVERRGLVVENNRVSRGTGAVLLNSFNFDAARFEAFRRDGQRVVHRIMGPVQKHRGADDGADRRMWELGRRFADASIFQSRYSERAFRELGYEFEAPVVIPNTVDPAIYHRVGRSSFSRARKTRLISVSWSDNPRKGAPTYRWIEERLDWRRFDYTFVGRSPIRFERIAMREPVPSLELAEILRGHDVFVAAGEGEVASNALMEALACGLPVVYLDSGCHVELVGEAGLGFTDTESILDCLETVRDRYDELQAAISVPTIAEVADRYLQVLGLSGALAPRE